MLPDGHEFESGVGASDADFVALGVPLTDPVNSNIKRVHFAGEFTSIKYRGSACSCV
jgi:hypothetical protein